MQEKKLTYNNNEALTKRQNDQKEIQRQMAAEGKYKFQIILAPTCMLCGTVLKINDNFNQLSHGESQWCINSGKEYRFLGKNVEDSEETAYKSYVNIKIEEIAK